MSLSPVPSQRGPHSAGSVPIKVFGPDTGIWVCVFVAFLAIQLRPGLDSTLGQDSFQYLSVAQNALDGHFGFTSLVHFDAERSFGVVPAPMVTFPSGYPFAIALVSLTGLSLAATGLLISLVSMVACVPLLAWLSNALGLSRVAGNAVIAGFATNAAVIVMATKVGSDALFTVLILLGVGLLILARRSLGKGANWVWIAVGFAFGLAYSVRYAALFFIVGLTFVVVRHVFLSSRDLATHYATAAAVAGVAALAGIARNIALVGNWRGGNDKVVSNPIASVLMETVRGANRLLLGPGSGVAGGTVLPRVALVTLLIVGMAWLVRRYMRRAAAEWPAMARAAAKGVGIDLLMLVVVYLACLFYAGLKSVIDYGDARYVAPLLPLLLLLSGLAVQKMLAAAPDGVRKSPILAFAASLSLYVYLNLLILQVPQQPGWLPIAAALDAKSADGKSVRAVVYGATGADGMVMANNGQTIGHLLGRRTVSLVGPHFSGMEWNEQSVRETARKFGVKAIVIYAPTSAEQWDDGDVVPSAFVKELAQGDAPPWMHLEFREANLFVYVPRTEGH